MASRMVRGEIEAELPCPEAPPNQSSPFQVAPSQRSEIITRSYNPEKKFWQTPPKLPDEKIAKATGHKEEIKFTIANLRAKAVAQLQKDKLTMTIGLPATPQNQAMQARGLISSCFFREFFLDVNFIVWSVCAFWVCI